MAYSFLNKVCQVDVDFISSEFSNCKGLWLIRNSSPILWTILDRTSVITLWNVSFLVCLSVLVGANDVTMTRHCRAGVLLKLMDECAGIVAAKHCQTNVVTACLNATNFYQMIPIGNYMISCFIHIHGVFAFKVSCFVQNDISFWHVCMPLVEITSTHSAFMLSF